MSGSFAHAPLCPDYRIESSGPHQAAVICVLQKSADEGIWEAIALNEPTSGTIYRPAQMEATCKTLITTLHPH